ncbi:MAG: hypothetical protein PWQ50_773 [Methanolobus sp.]|nr:hypothetical protein [Methanolobus sp.]
MVTKFEIYTEDGKHITTLTAKDIMRRSNLH